MLDFDIDSLGSKSHFSDNKICDWENSLNAHSFTFPSTKQGGSVHFRDDSEIKSHN